ncbi:MAG: hypothetical protein JW839_22755 [Candidatus Lokiarchaeota archaeon]|nr:hypothetical protein [Candidatus Lokiarchaeota archaeon]
MSQEPNSIDESTRRHGLSADPRKNLYDETLHARSSMLPTRREISRNNFNKFDEFIAGVCDEAYSSLVERRKRKRKEDD